MTLQFAYTGGEGHSISIQWYHDGVALVDGVFGDVTVSGSTTTTLTITNPTAEYEGEYFARVIDNDVPNCSVDTEGVTVTVPGLCRLEITVQPIAIDTSAGEDVELSFSYTGATGEVVIQWYREGVALTDGAGPYGTISGSTTTTLLIGDATEEASGSYYATITDTGVADCSLQTDTVLVDVGPGCALTIDTQPADTDVALGGELSLTVVYSGAVGPVTLQWRLNGVDLVDGPAAGGAVISGATTTNLVITGMTEELAGEYDVVITDTGVPGCVVTSNLATVAVGTCNLSLVGDIVPNICNLVIAVQPTPEDLEVGDTLNLSFTYTGFGGPFSIQWFQDGTPLVDGTAGGVTISGATTPNLTITNIQEANAGDYHATIDNDGVASCADVTDTVAVTVTPPPPASDPTAYWRLAEINEPIVDGRGPATDRADSIGSSTLFNTSGVVDGFEDAQGGAAASAFFDASFGTLDTTTIATFAYTTGNNVSFSFWVKARESIVGLGSFLELTLNLGDNQIQFNGNISGPNTILDVFVTGESGADDFFTINPLSMTVDQWYMWTFVYNGTTGLLDFYIDTVLVASTTVPVVFSTQGDGNLRLRQTPGSPETLVSQLGLWLNWGLTSPQITYLYNGGAGRDWPFTLP